MRFIPRHLAPPLTRDVNSTTFKDVLARLLQYISSTVFQDSIRGSSIRENVIRLVQPVTLPHAPYFLNFNLWTSGKGESSPFLPPEFWILGCFSFPRVSQDLNGGFFSGHPRDAYPQPGLLTPTIFQAAQSGWKEESTRRPKSYAEAFHGSAIF